MFYTCLLPVLALSLFMIFKLRRMQKHDVVLYQFCQIRRDAIKLIDERGTQFSRAGYHSTRHLLDNLSVMIRNYDGCKANVFNIRRLIQALKDYRHSSRQVEKIQIPNDLQIMELHSRFRHAMLEAFLAYTPWIKSEICAWILLSILRFFARAGNKTIESAGNYLAWLREEMKDTEKHNRPHCIA